MSDAPPNSPDWMCWGFVVNQTPYAIWSSDKREQQIFVDSFNPRYFGRLAELYSRELSTNEDDFEVATALRSTYVHGLETLFAVMFATLQAPQCPAGWLHKYSRKDLSELIDAIQNGRPILSQVPLDESSWKGICSGLFKAAHIDVMDAETSTAVEMFAKEWALLASDFLSDPYEEYNSIKHGFRARSGGFALYIGDPIPPGGSRPPNDELQKLAESKHGTMFRSLEKIKGSKLHFNIRRFFVNWDPEKLATHLRWISLSLSNFVAFLTAVHSSEPRRVEVLWPLHEDALGRLRTEHLAARADFGTRFRYEHVQTVSEADILAGYKSYPDASATPTPTTPPPLPAVPPEPPPPRPSPPPAQ